MYPSAKTLILLVIAALSVLATDSAFCLALSTRAPTKYAPRRLSTSGRRSSELSATNTDSVLIDEKVKLVTLCTQGSKPSLSDVQSFVARLEQTAENMGVGQSSSSTGLLNGEWYDQE
jgi:hypothetical protein